ncbi:YgaP family membrane protein [Sphingobacterium humi]|uniref:DUF2892 domain-containing protein n=1 Tax=Sphingobacterium humi TaxID=1796905 RepID=A0A6N8KTL0_9SPHI|nr:DUF2892 domain-containing protein [Sphingobacterium humi]MVZ60783.1 DUF2892 domain-containing protein [Sphingobacterium humi]
MRKNMGTADRVIRIGIAIIIAVLFFTEVITGSLGIILMVIAGILILSSLVAFCPLYYMFGLRTCKNKHMHEFKNDPNRQ